MAETYNQALVSVDTQFIKQVRATYKGKVTRSLSALKEVLQYTGGDSNVFDLDNIDPGEVETILSSLKLDNKAVGELHIRYEVTRKHVEGADEEALVKKDDEYITEVESKVREGMKLYNSYFKQKNAKQILSQEAAKYTLKLEMFKQQKQGYENIYKEALVVVDSEDFEEMRTAQHQKSFLKQEFDKLVSLGTELLAVAPQAGSAVSETDKEMFDLSKERLTFGQVLTKLEKVIKKVELQDKKEMAKLSKPDNVVMSSEGGGSGGNKSNILKLKVKPPVFSEKGWEFSVFKRDFNTFVSVDDRTDIEISTLLN